MFSISKSKSHLLYPADLLEKAFNEYYPNVDFELHCEPHIVVGKPYWAFDNYRCNGTLKGASHLFYTQPGWGSAFQAQGENGKCVTYACDPELHKPVDVKKEYDVGFIGNGGGENTDRDEYLKFITNTFSNHLITDKVASENIGLEYSKCRVIFNHIRYEEINIRFFEALALGAQVCSYKPSLHLFAKEGKHYLTFKTKEEAQEKINFLLEHDDVREKMAKDARKHVIENHTYKDRAEEIILFIKGKL